jgi:Flp pilus assembly protein TadD, contains TPR repeats
MYAHTVGGLMNPHNASSSNEDNNSDLEERKYKLEYEKFLISKNSLRLDLFSKIAIPVSVFVLSYATYVTNNELTSRKIEQDTNSKNMELAIKNKELAVNTEENKRKHNREIGDFAKNNYDAIISNKESDKAKIDFLIKTSIPKDEQPQIIFEIGKLRAEVSKFNASIKEDTHIKDYTTYKEMGKSLLRDGKYEDAISYYKIAVLLNKSDAELLMFLSYAQFKAKQFEDAYLNIGDAILLANQSEYKDSVKLNMVINATKILCAQKKFEFANTYWQSSVKKFPALIDTVKNDVELVNVCKMNYR